MRRAENRIRRSDAQRTAPTLRRLMVGDMFGASSPQVEYVPTGEWIAFRAARPSKSTDAVPSGSGDGCMFDEYRSQEARTLKALGLERPDIVVSDLSMLDMDVRPT